jgi:hypothetical protein
MSYLWESRALDQVLMATVNLVEGLELCSKSGNSRSGNTFLTFFARYCAQIPASWVNRKSCRQCKMCSQTPVKVVFAHLIFASSCCCCVRGGKCSSGRWTIRASHEKSKKKGNEIRYESGEGGRTRCGTLLNLPFVIMSNISPTFIGVSCQWRFPRSREIPPLHTSKSSCAGTLIHSFSGERICKPDDP